MPIGARTAIGSSSERPNIWILSFQLDFLFPIFFPFLCYDIVVLRRVLNLYSLWQTLSDASRQKRYILLLRLVALKFIIKLLQYTDMGGIILWD